MLHALSAHWSKKVLKLVVVFDAFRDWVERGPVLR